MSNVNGNIELDKARKCDLCSGAFIYRYSCADCYLTGNNFASTSLKSLNDHHQDYLGHRMQMVVCERCLENKYKMYAVVMGDNTWAGFDWIEVSEREMKGLNANKR